MNRLDITLPHSLDSERAILGSILMYNEDLYGVLSFLDPSDFYHAGHGELYSWMRQKITLGKAVDPIILKENKELVDMVGGIQYIAEHIDFGVKITDIRRHGLQVRRFAKLRALIKLGFDLVDRGQDRDAEPGSIAESAETVFADISQTEASNLFTLEEIGDERSRHYAELQQRKESPVEIPTGLIDLDSKIAGMHRQEFIIIGARPSMGKTALAFQIFDHITSNGFKAVYFSPDQNKESLFNRTVSRRTRIDGFRLRTGQLDPGEWKRVFLGTAETMKKNAWVDDTGGISLNQIRATCRKLKSSHGLDVAFVDHVQLVTHKLDRGMQGTVRQVVTEISHELKRLAKDLKIAVVGVSQLNRDLDRYQKPELANLKESGDLEQDADVVLFPWVSLTKQTNGPAKEITKISVEKNKHGETGDITVTFLKSFTGFFDAAKESA